MGYEGGLRKFPEFASRKLIAEKALGRVIETKEMLEDSGPPWMLMALKELTGSN